MKLGDNDLELCKAAWKNLRNKFVCSPTARSDIKLRTWSLYWAYWQWCSVTCSLVVLFQKCFTWFWVYCLLLRLPALQQVASRQNRPTLQKHRYTSRAVDCLFTPGRPFDLKAHFSTTISGRRPFQKEVFNAQSYAALDSSRSLPRISPLIREPSVFLGADQLCTECEPVTLLPRIGAAFPVMSLHFSALWSIGACPYRPVQLKEDRIHVQRRTFADVFYDQPALWWPVYGHSGVCKARKYTSRSNSKEAWIACHITFPETAHINYFI